MSVCKGQLTDASTGRDKIKFSFDVAVADIAYCLLKRKCLKWQISLIKNILTGQVDYLVSLNCACIELLLCIYFVIVVVLGEVVQFCRNGNLKLALCPNIGYNISIFVSDGLQGLTV